MDKKKELIVAIVPAKNESSNIALFSETALTQFDLIEKNDGKCEFRILFIDDGSTDNTLNEIKKVCLSSSKVKYVSFSRNFGKEAALMAGLQYSLHAECEAAVIIDCDLQDPPSLIGEMLKKYREGYSRVTARHKERRQSFFRRLFSNIFYHFFARITGFEELKKGARDFSLISRRAIQSYVTYGGTVRFTKGIMADAGFKTAYIECDYSERKKGKTKFTFAKLCKYAMQGCEEFSQAVRLITVPLLFISIGFAIFDIVTIVSLGKSLIDSTAFRIDLVAVMIALVSDISARLYYRLKKEIIDRPLYFVESTNDPKNML